MVGDPKRRKWRKKNARSAVDEAPILPARIACVACRV